MIYRTERIVLKSSVLSSDVFVIRRTDRNRPREAKFASD